MGDTAVSRAEGTGSTTTITEIDILWMTAGLGCDGDTIAMTGATQPSIEDIVLGALPWTPKVNFYNPFLAYENGDDFVRPFRDAAEDKSGRPFILVVEGSIPDENNKSEGYWASFGTDPLTGQPITTCEWIDRLAPKAWAIIATGTCATYGGIHAMEGNPTGCMGLPDYLGWKWKSKAGIPIVCVPGCPVQPDNMTETVLYSATRGNSCPCLPRPISFEGQAAIWLEQLACTVAATEPYPFPFVERELDFRPLLQAVIRDRMRGRSPAEIARAFQRGVSQGLRDAASAICEVHELDTIVLSGGVFQNELLLEDFRSRVADEPLRVWTNRAVPPNDGGISLGQAALAAFGRFDESS
jgi:hypothetical protein